MPHSPQNFAFSRLSPPHDVQFTPCLLTHGKLPETKYPAQAPGGPLPAGLRIGRDLTVSGALSSRIDRSRAAPPARSHVLSTVDAAWYHAHHHINSTDNTSPMGAASVGSASPSTDYIDPIRSLQSCRCERATHADLSANTANNTG